MRTVLEIVVLLLATILPAGAGININIEAVQKSVVFIYGATPDGMQDTRQQLGTGFLVALPLKGHLDRMYVVLITARHIFDPNWDYCSFPNPQRVFIRVNKKNYDPVKDPSGVQYLPLQLIQDGKPTYFVSDDPMVDAAFVLLDPSKVPQDQYDFKPMALSSFANPTEIGNLTIGDSVVSAGLIPEKSGEKRNYPFFKFGNISSIPGEPIWSQCGNGLALRLERVWFIAANLVPGNSGSPVFYVPGGGGGLVLGSTNSRAVLIGVQSTSMLGADISGMTPVEDLFRILQVNTPHDSDLYRGPEEQRPKNQNSTSKQ